MAQPLLAVIDCGQQQADDWLESWQHVLETCQDITSLAVNWDSAFCLTVDPAITFIIFTTLIFLNLQRKLRSVLDSSFHSSINHDITVLHGVKSKQEEEEATTGVDEQTNEPTQESEPITQRTYKQTR